ncbi:PfkB family carbohydrate kinase [Phaeacidiphilus oryzae]|uniref:PfkB family carbohydrate kinase n=1 Tax=Phaeacidiphilus oryzae TaxID=348818 RepID=UPI00055CAFA4|nr:PfkB family carbohydrate kinase [Phaeacidiphilus oryzae]
MTGGPVLYLAGGVLVDLVMRVPRLPERGGDLFAEDAEFTPGGGFNVLTAARRQGLRAVYAGAHGTGPFGDRVRAGLAAEGIGTLLPAVEGRDTGFCVALVERGERTFVTASGAEGRLSVADAGALRERLRPGDLVQLSGYQLAGEGTAEALEWLVRRLPEEVVLSFDPGPMAGGVRGELLDLVLGRCDWLSLNRREAELLGVDGGEHGRRLKGGTVLRADADGCWVRAPGEERALHVPAVPVEAVDPNGAGDAHVGTFLAGLAAGQPPAVAAARANAAAAYAVTRPGPATAPTPAELDAFMAARWATG